MKNQILGEFQEFGEEGTEVVVFCIFYSTKLIIIYKYFLLKHKSIKSGIMYTFIIKINNIHLAVADLANCTIIGLSFKI